MYVRFVPANALDIETNATDTMYHSQEEEHSWWLLDLGETRTIHAVEILSRLDNSPERLHDVEIRVGSNLATNYEDFSHYIYFSTYAGPYSADQGRLSCFRADGVSGRFVAIMKVKPSDTDQLQLVDVNVLVRKE
ncbi:hypothetical protein E2C01_049203 [Portunus trituberculatus]|uniref:F5/8 type C domain-containing protein n=1 Tax=Portunus trituberculatus TaxID=210409 RepID=A0A5B7G5J7_PORTR|nr:hypothetical protein [Portunus trituberculatus]